MNYNPMNLPKLDFYINDFSGILREDFKVKYNNLFSEHQKISGEQIATVFIEHRNGNELIDIAMKLFNENAIGDKETNNGLLLIVSTSEKKIRIMTGKGMEIEFSDEYCKEIIENELRTLLNNGEYEKLIQAWYEISTKKRKPIKNEINNFGNTNNNNPKYNPNDYYNTQQNKNEKISNLVGNFIAYVVLVIFILLVIALSNLRGCSSSNNYGNSNSGWGSSSSSDWGNSSPDWGGGSSNAGGSGD